MKTINELKQDLFETFVPMDLEMVMSNEMFGSLVTRGEARKYLEGEEVLIKADDNFYSIDYHDFLSFRLNTMEERLFFQGDLFRYDTLDEAIAYANEKPNEVAVISFNIFKDIAGDFTETAYFVTFLEA